ncbi:unnamed protein product [Effrenium voratum]|nr:unnamed protein product [Effrenium voratum]
MPSACPGLDGEPCAFSAARPGAAASKRPGHAACVSWPRFGFSRSLARQPLARAKVFCSPQELADACLQGPRRAQLKRCLLALAPDQQRLALERVPEDFRAGFRAALADPKTCREPCVFAQRGGPARTRRGVRCLFCAPEDLWPLCYEDPGRSQVLERLRDMPPASRVKALEERLLPEHASWFAEQLALARRPRRPAGPPAVRRRPSAAVPRAEVAARWQRILAARRPLGAVSAAEKKLYREKVLADRARARRRMGQPPLRTPRGAAVSNDSGLPPAKRGKRCADFERWCEHHSWAACEKCGLLLARDLTEATLTKDQKATAAAGQCWRCRGARDLPALCLLDVPEELRGLTAAAMEALSPLEIDVGPIVRAQHGSGYRQHSTMMRFRWQPRLVKDRIKELPAPRLRRAPWVK